MKFTDSLKHNYEFRRVYARGKSAASGTVVVYCRRNGCKENRLGVTAGGKIGNAVHRNRVRRRLKEIYRLNEERFRRGFDIVLVARVKSNFASFSQIEEDVLALAEELGLICHDQEKVTS